MGFGQSKPTNQTSLESPRPSLQPTNQTSLESPRPSLTATQSGPGPVMAQPTPPNIDIWMMDGSTYSTYLDPKKNLNELISLSLERERGIRDVFFYLIKDAPVNETTHQDYLDNIYMGKIGSMPLFYTQPIYLLPQMNGRYIVGMIQTTPEDMKKEKQDQKLTLDILILRFQLNYVRGMVKNQPQITIKKLKDLYQTNLRKLTQGEIVFRAQYQILDKLRYIVDFARRNKLEDRLRVYLLKALYICETHYNASSFLNQKVGNTYLALDILLDNLNRQAQYEFYYFYDKIYDYQVPHTAMVVEKYLQLILNNTISLNNIILYGDTIPTILNDTWDRWNTYFRDTQDPPLQQQNENPSYDPNGVYLRNRLVRRLFDL